jgi:hypothetical protein
MIPIYFCTTKHKNSHNCFLGLFSHFKFQVIERLIGKQAFKDCSFPLGKGCTFREIGVCSSCMSCRRWQSSPLCGVQAVSFLSFQAVTQTKDLCLQCTWFSLVSLVIMNQQKNFFLNFSAEQIIQMCMVQHLNKCWNCDCKHMSQKMRSLEQ